MKVYIKKIIHYIILFLLIIVPTFLILEFFIRLFPYQNPTNQGIPTKEHFTADELTGFKLIPNIVDLERGIHTDSFGNRIVSKKFNPKKRSIVFVGDSTVFSWGVRDKFAYPYIFSIDSDFDSYNIVNLGVPSYGINSIEKVLAYNTEKYNPKIVVVSILWPPFALNDEQEIKNYSPYINYNYYKNIFGIKTSYEWKHESLFKSKILSFCQTCSAAKFAFFYFRYPSRIKMEIRRPGVNDYNISSDTEIKLANLFIGRLLIATDKLKKRGVRVIFYLHPYYYTVFDNKYLSLGKPGYNQVVEKLPAFDIKKILQEHFNQNDALYIDNCHFSERGNSEIHKILKPLVMNELALP